MTDDTHHRPGFLRRHRPAVIVGLVVVALAATIVATIRLSTHPGPSVRQVVAPTTLAPLHGAGAELVGLLEAGTKLAFDGRYRVSAEREAAGTLRLWSRPPLLRVDTELGSGTDMRRRAQFSLPSGTVGCNRQAEVWTCRSQPNLPLGLGLLPEGFSAQVSRYSVEARTERVGVHDARCFSLSGGQGPPGEVCVTSEGVPVRVRATTATSIELAELDRSPPPDEIFQPPAPLS